MAARLMSPKYKNVRVKFQSNQRKKLLFANMMAALTSQKKTLGIIKYMLNDTKNILFVVQFCLH